MAENENAGYSALMAGLNLDDVIAQIDAAILKFKQSYRQRGHLPYNEISESVTLMRAAIERLAPPASAYRKSADEVVAKYGADGSSTMAALAGILAAMRADYAAGRLEALHELLHGEVFADFLEMADHLHGEGYKDAAAVMAGSVLEEHLRQLCEKHGVEVARANIPKKASALNDELKAALDAAGTAQAPTPWGAVQRAAWDRR